MQCLKTYSFLCLLFYVLSSGNLSAQSAIGVNVGLVNTKLTGDQPSAGWIGIDKGYCYGLNYSYRINQTISLGTKVDYLVGRAKYIYADSSIADKDSFKITVQSISVPLDFIIWSESGRFYLTAGLELLMPLKIEAIQVDKTVNITEEIHNYLLSAHFGVGLIVPVGKPHLFFSVCYTQGLMDMNGSRIHDSDKSYLPRTKYFSLSVEMGLRVPFGSTGFYDIKKKKNVVEVN